ncbi:hypothetical protein SAMN04487894_10926, partial [Niabella drilacis]
MAGKQQNRRCRLSNWSYSEYRKEHIDKIAIKKRGISPFFYPVDNLKSFTVAG